MPIRVLIADDHKIVREGLRNLLEREQEMTVLGEAEDGHKAVEMASRLSPDIVLMDIGMPNLNGIEATRRILAAGVECKIIMLSMYSDKRFLTESFAAGASGYLLKDCAFEEVVSAVRAVRDGKAYLCPSVAKLVVSGIADRKKGDGTRLSDLTSREREVLQLIAEGKSTKQIAALLKVSVKTVETHRMNIMDKLEIRSVPELTKYAIREGLTSLQ